MNGPGLTIEPTDMSDPKVQRQIESNVAVAKLLLDQLRKHMLKRQRRQKMSDEEVMTAMINTVGVMNAELIGSFIPMERAIGAAVARPVSVVLTSHIENALIRRGAME